MFIFDVFFLCDFFCVAFNKIIQETIVNSKQDTQVRASICPKNGEVNTDS